MRFIATASILFAFSSFAMAEPITIETDHARIIVVKPLDMWSGDKSALETSLESHKEKTAWYFLKLNDRKWLSGNPNLTQSASNHPLTNEVAKQLKDAGFSLPRSSRNSFTIEMPIVVPAENINDLLDFQSKAFKANVLALGNPDELQSKTSRNKFFGGILALGTTVVAADKLGAVIGASTTIGSGISEGIYNLASQYKGGIVPIQSDRINTEEFKEFELRKVPTAAPDRTGQILIAYRVAKTPEIEEAALVKAIVELTGANASQEQIELARIRDLETRKSIWQNCVDSNGPACKK
jgi:hypothetical protein